MKDVDYTAISGTGTLDLSNIKGTECELPIRKLLDLVDDLAYIVKRLAVAYGVTLVIAIAAFIALLIWL